MRHYYRNRERIIAANTQYKRARRAEVVRAVRGPDLDDLDRVALERWNPAWGNRVQPNPAFLETVVNDRSREAAAKG